MKKLRDCACGIAMLICLWMMGCNHQDLYYEPVRKNVSVRIEFDWTDAQDASPKEMTVYFYRLDAKSRASARIFDFKGANGGVVTMPMGEYAALCHNSDGVNHSYIGVDGHETFGLCLNDMHSAPSGEERFAHCPEPTWVASVPAMVIEDPDQSLAQGDQVVRFRMQAVVNQYTFIIHTPVNLTPSHSIMASISGMASTVHPGQGSTGDETVSHVFSMTKSADGALVGQMLTYGHCARKPLTSRDGGDSDEAAHLLNIYATLPDNKQWRYTHDVTSHIHNSPVADCVVELDSLVLPPPEPSGGGGLQPTVGGWSGSQEPLGM